MGRVIVFFAILVFVAIVLGKSEEDDGEEMLGEFGDDADECFMDFVVPKEGEKVEFRFPNPADSYIKTQTRVNEADGSQISFRISSIPVPKGIGIYFKTSPLNTTRPKFVENRMLDSGTTMKLLNGTGVWYKDETKLFQNYKYSSVLMEDKPCREYEVTIELGMSEMMKYGRSGANRHGIYMQLPFVLGYFIRNLNQRSEEEPFFVNAERLVDATLGMSRQGDTDEEDDDDFFNYSDLDDDDDDDLEDVADPSDL